MISTDLSIADQYHRTSITAERFYDRPAPAIQPPRDLHREVVIVGGGAAGLTVAALLRNQPFNPRVTVVEPSELHDYQAAWTLVGAGLLAPASTQRLQARCIPAGTEWIKARVEAFEPDLNRVLLEDGRRIFYTHLVIAVGLELNWQAVEGLESALGRGGVTSNFRRDLALYTWDCVHRFRGGRVLFTRPSMPLKCAAAAQSAMYLTADLFRRNRVQTEMHYFTVGRVMHSVPYYHQALTRVATYYGAVTHFDCNLVAVDGRRHEAVFEVIGGSTARHVTERYDLLHVTPPQRPPSVIRNSSLANERGWLDIDPHSLRHTRYKNIFGLGDCTGTANIKSVAAIRAQAPIVVDNLVASIHNQPLQARYDGYGACPVATSLGKVMLVESIYNGAVAPSFSFDSRVPRRLYWWMNRYYFPRLYWNMLDGHLGLDWHAARKLRSALPEFTP